jgi:hypothetical protein
LDYTGDQHNRPQEQLQKIHTHLLSFVFSSSPEVIDRQMKDRQ